MQAVHRENIKLFKKFKIRLFGYNFGFEGIKRGKTHIWGYAEGYNFDLGVHPGSTILIWGYAEEYNFDFGVTQVPKV
jgi:hypothetical protein